MNSSRMLARRMVASPAMRKQPSPMASGRWAVAFSTECAPAQKLRTVLEEYRQTKYVSVLLSHFDTFVTRAVP